MPKRLSMVALLAIGVMSALPSFPGIASAQSYGYDDRPPPRFEDGYRRPPPPPNDEDGYRRRPPPPRYADEDDDDAPLLCRTPEGSCRGRGPQSYRARCFCDFGDGPVRGRMR